MTTPDALTSLTLLTLVPAAQDAGANPAAPPVNAPVPGLTDAAPGSTAAPGTPGAGTNTTAPPPAGFPIWLWLPMLLFAFLMLSSMMTGRREKKKRAELLSAMKKHDRVETVGGILGTIVEVGDHDILVRVDDHANTRIRFVKSAIRTVLVSADGPKDASPELNVETKSGKRAGATA